MKQFAYTVLLFVLNTLAGLILKINNLKGAKLQMIHLFAGMSGGELLEIRLLNNHLLDTFGSKSTARHKIYQLLESS